MNRLHRWFCKSPVWRKTLEQQLLPWALRDTELGEDVLEIGPGPGLVTDVLRSRTSQLTSIEIDPVLASSLSSRLRGTNVTVVEGDATDMPFEDGRFTSAVSFTMLHHVPSRALQDRLLAEVLRVLRPGASFVGSDSLTSRSFELFHLFDTLVPVDPETFETRLEAVGFESVAVKSAGRSFRFRAQRPN